MIMMHPMHDYDDLFQSYNHDDHFDYYDEHYELDVPESWLSYFIS